MNVRMFRGERQDTTDRGSLGKLRGNGDRDRVHTVLREAGTCRVIDGCGEEVRARAVVD